MKVTVILGILVFALNSWATTPNPKIKQTTPTNQSTQSQLQQTKDCVKHPIIVKSLSTTKVITIQKTQILDKTIKVSTLNRSVNSLSHYSVLNFINFFYTKDTLDNLHVM